MDIVDIDEVLNEDSFCLLEEKNQDDIANILQQWKNNQQGIKFDTRTYIRPKRKSIQSLENANSADSKSNAPVNLQIGGLVTNIRRNPLQDASPPFSAYASTDLLTEQMSSSLITSADFTNVSFFKTTNSEDLLTELHDELSEYSPENKLENLSLSGESTLSKDKNIFLTDDILCNAYNDGDRSKSINEELNLSITHSSDLRGRNCDLPNSKKAIFEKNTVSIAFEFSDILLNSMENNINSSEDLRYASIDIGTSDNTICNKTFEKGSKQKNMYIAGNTFSSIAKSEGLHGADFISKEQINLLDSKCKISKRNEYDLIVEDRREIFLQSTPYHHKSNKNLHEEKKNLLPLSPIDSIKASYSPISATCSKKIVDKYKNDSIYFTKNPAIDYNQSKINEKTELEINNSIAHFELCAKQSEDDFDEMLKSFGRTAFTDENQKMRQSIDNIKKRHSTACDSPVEDPKSTVTNKNSFSVCSERLLSRRGRLNDEISFNSETELTSKKEIDLYSNDPHNNKISQDNIMPADVNAPENLNGLENQQRFRTMRMTKQPVVSIKKPQANFVRFYPKEKNIITSNCNLTKCTKKELTNAERIETIEIYKRNEENVKNSFIAKAPTSCNKDSEKNSEVFETSNLGKSRQILKTNTAKGDKRPLTSKAKSYQNLSSQFGFSKPSEEFPSQLHSKKSDSEGHMEFLEQKVFPKERIMEPKNCLFKVPVITAPMCASSQRRSGLVRPSSGFYSCNVKKVESGLDNSRNSSNNSLSSLSSKGSVQELYKKYTYEYHSDDNIDKSRLNVGDKSKKVVSMKSNISKPSSLGNSATRKSVIPLPTKNTFKR